MKVAVIGCGGIGGVIAGILALNKQNPYCIVRTQESSKIINERGLQVRGKKGNFKVQVRAFPGLAKDMGGFDIIIIAVKSNSLRRVFTEAIAYLCDDGFIVTTQNGIEILSIAEEFTDTKIIAGAVSYNSVMNDYGDYYVTSEGGITFGALGRGNRDDIFLLKSLLEQKIKVYFTGNPSGVLWSKLAIVCGVTGLGGISGLFLGELLRHRVTRQLFYRIVTEVSLLAQALGIRMEKLGGAINPERFGNHRKGYPLFIRYLLMRVFGMKYKNLKSNIYHSIERGRKTEIDYINGTVVVKGEKVGLNTPINTQIVQITREIEERKREMGIRNLHQIWERVSKEE